MSDIGLCESLWMILPELQEDYSYTHVWMELLNFS